MPIETRYIVFSDDELITASLEYCREARIPVPQAAIERVHLSADAERQVTLTFAVQSPVEIDQVVLNSQQLLFALLRFCQINNIPLPHEPEKVIRYENGALELLIRNRCRTRAKAHYAA